MATQQVSRAGAASGAVFAVLLVAAAGDGGGFNPVRAVLGMFALTLAIPFLCTVARMLRGADTSSGWLVDTAVAAGIGGIVLKIASATPELALHRAHVAAGTSMHRVLTALGDGATIISLFPLALFCAATATVAVRVHALPRWLTGATYVTALALVVNGCFLTTDFVPALLVFALWALLTSGHLVLASRKQSVVRTADAPVLQG